MGSRVARIVPSDEVAGSLKLALNCGDEMVRVTGFEPAASSSRTKRATKLRHTPWLRLPPRTRATRTENSRATAPAPNRVHADPGMPVHFVPAGRRFPTSAAPGMPARRHDVVLPGDGPV